MTKIGSLFGILIIFAIFLISSNYFIKEFVDAFRETKRIKLSIEPSVFSYATKKDKVEVLGLAYLRIMLFTVTFVFLVFLLVKALVFLVALLVG